MCYNGLEQYNFLLEQSAPSKILQQYSSRLQQVQQAIQAQQKTRMNDKNMQFQHAAALAASLDGGNIPVLVYDKLLEAIHAKMPAMYRYVALRKKLLGVDELHMYDVYVSLTKEYEQKYTYEQAIEIVKKALAVLGDDYVALLDKGFSERWVDVYENEGKRAVLTPGVLTIPIRMC